MDKNEVLKLLQAVLLMHDGVSDGELLLKYNFGPQILKAREVIKLIEKNE